MKAVVDTVREVANSFSYGMITKSVDGLFCPIESQFEHAARICNISTRQVSSSFRSTLSEEPLRHQYGTFYALKYRCRWFQYRFGFDHATNEHKLVCVWHVQPHDDDHHCFICEVLTLGRQGGINSWRRINDVPPPYKLTNDSVYVNGVIYWSTYHLKNGFWNSIFGPISIVAFDVRMAYHFRDDSIYDSHVSLLEVNGSLAMLIRVNPSVFKMYTYEKVDYKKEGGEDIDRASTSTIFSSSSNERWIEFKSVTLPLDLKENRVKFHTFVESDDKIIVIFYDRRGCGKKVGKNKCLFFYYFNWKKDSWMEFEVSGIPSEVPHICFNSSFSTFSESLLPVNNQAALS